MKKAIALGILLSASLVSFAFAQVTVVNRVVDVISAGQPIKFDKNGEQLIIHNLQKHLVSIEFNFSSEYLSGHIGVVEYPPYTTNTYEIWISKTPGGTPLPGFEKMTTNGLGGPIEFKHPSLKALGGRYAIPGMFKYLDHGKYYYNLLPSDPTYSAVAHTLRTASMSSQDEVKVFSPSTISNTLPVSKRWDDFVTTLTTRVTVDLSGTQAGAVAFGSWRYYSGTPADLDMLSVTATPAFTYPVGMVDLVVSPIEGSFTPISPECSLQTEQTLALKRNATMMRFTTKKFEELTEAQKRLGYCILQPDTKYYMNVRFVDKNGATTCTKDRCGVYIDVNYSGTVSSTKSSSAPFTPAPIVLNSAGTPIVTSTYDLNANPATRLIPATGGTRSVAIAFPSTKGGTFMMSPGVNEYIRPDRTEVNISNKPNDFTPIQPMCNQVNEISSEINLQWVIKASDQPSWGACILEPNKIYYFNIRYVKADGTTACREANCGAYVDLPPLGTITVPKENTTPTNSSCSLLSKNLATGSKDALTGGEVTKLQTFLQGSYLSVSPTGYYGNMTVSAVKSFQGAYGISQLGIVGPATRAKINELHCSGATLVIPQSTQTTSVVKNVTTPTPSYQGGSGILVFSPFAGQSVRNESAKPSIVTITWEQTTGVKADTVTIDLYDVGGSYVKTIAQGTSNSGSYVWRYDPTLENGTYKIIVKGGSVSGESGVFSIGGDGTVMKAMTTTGGSGVSEPEGSTPESVEKILDFGNTVYKRFNPSASAGKTIAYSFDFVGYEMGKISMVEDVNSVAGDNGSYTIWLSKTPGGAPITVKNAGGTPFIFEKQSWGWHGGTLTIASAKNPYGGIILTPGKYYFNVTSALKTSYWAQINMTKDILLIENEAVEKVAKRWDDFVTTLTTRVTVDLSGTQAGAVAFGSWRYYSGTPTSLDMLSVTATPAFTYPVGMVDLVVSPIEGSFTPISPECSLQTEQTLALERNATMMRFTTKKFEELTEAQKRLGYCILQPNTKYYMNVRFVDKNGATTCTKDKCGIYIDVNYSAVPGYSAGQSNSGIVPVSAQTILLPTTEEIINFTGLKRGANEIRVSRLKSILNTIPTSTSAGCVNLSTSNTLFGPTTEDCVKAFQTMNQLTPTGGVDEATNVALNKMLVR